MLKTALSTAVLFTFGAKNLVSFGPPNRVYAANVYPPNINSARDFGQLYISIANISGTDQAIEQREKALLTTIPPAFKEETLVH